MMRALSLFASLAMLFGAAAHSAARGADILWDHYDVPHIYADDDAAASRALGWVQMQQRAQSILRLYGIARGRAAEYWGEPYFERDVLTRRLGFPQHAAQWLKELPAADRVRLDAFTAGMNAFARAHPKNIPAELQAVLPLQSVDVLAHMTSVVFLTYLAPTELSLARQAEEALSVEGRQRGSNAYAIAPSRSKSGRAMLVINPHLDWQDEFLFTEMQISSPSGSIYGIAAVGSPVISIGFSEAGGWTHTVNSFDGSDIYALTLVPGGYLLDGKVTPFTTREETLQVRQADGRLLARRFQIQHSIHGPVVMEGAQGRAYALRIAALAGTRGMLRQYWDMAAAKDLPSFEEASSRLQMPFFNTVYANRDGHIYYLYGGQSPVKPVGDWDFWSKVVPGDRSEFIWNDRQSLPYSAMPHFSDPASGFIQNANDVPWSTTYPYVLEPGDFVPYMSPLPDMDMRAQRSMRRVLASEKISFDELVAMKQDNGLELADRVLGDLLAAAATSSDPIVVRAAGVLKEWDRKTNAESRGGVLFLEWARLARKPSDRALFAEMWDSSRPTSTPRGLANPTRAVAQLKEAAIEVERRWARLDIAWGEAYRIRRDGLDLPASGGPSGAGSYRAMWAQRADSGPRSVSGGDTFVAVVEFGERVHAVGLLPYGNSDTAGTPANKAQLELFSQGELRPIWFYRDAVERNTARRERVR